MAWTTPATATAGSTALTAAFWNTQVRDNMVEVAPFMAAWTSFTPQLRTGTTNRTSTVLYARYVVVGKFVWVNAAVTASATGGANEVIKLSLPTGVPSSFAAASTDIAIGTFQIKDTGTAFYVGSAHINDNVSGTYFIGGLSYNSVGAMGVSAPAMTMASGDVISYSVMYEIN